LSGIVENNIFKDTVFYVYTNEGLDLETLDFFRDNLWLLDLWENLPAFIFNRDTEKRFEKNKFLFPDP